MSDVKEKVIDFVSAIAPKRDAVIEKQLTTRYGEEITVPAIYSDRKAEYEFCEYHTKGQQWTVGIYRLNKNFTPSNSKYFNSLYIKYSPLCPESCFICE